MEEWKIAEKVYMIVRDNGRNVASAFRGPEYNAIGCFIHTIQLTVNKGCLSQSEVSNMLTCARKLVGSFRHSVMATKTLLEQQKDLGLPQHKLFQDVSTRWNSTYYLLSRLVEQKNAVKATCSKLEIDTDLRPNHWNLATKVIDILSIFEEATLAASQDNATIGVIIPLVGSLKRSLEDEGETDIGVKKMKRCMLLDLTERYPDTESNSYYAHAQCRF